MNHSALIIGNRAKIIKEQAIFILIIAFRTHITFGISPPSIAKGTKNRSITHLHLGTDESYFRFDVTMIPF